ncbi:type II toxin-antitoxin system HicA family toxin [Marinobacter sp. LV10R510-11A]|uniref:type II toxin-antitoxin system HicA family toxin n=1 Tax=Marinobacter sp. LV10R510-11A TaxID=1415568 RepID=UPI0022282229|nr:type II toxin-antitoxin system HicA family toxin [Marinobacter sp. LV10R510-11A]
MRKTIQHKNRRHYQTAESRRLGEGGGKGDHEKFKHPNKPGHVVVPHPRKDMLLGTLRSIFRQAGWDWR